MSKRNIATSRRKSRSDSSSEANRLFATGMPAPSEYYSGISPSRSWADPPTSRDYEVNQGVSQFGSEDEDLNYVDRPGSASSNLRSFPLREDSLTCCHGNISAVGSFSDLDQEASKAGGDWQNKDTRIAKFADYIKASGFSRIIEACITKLNEGETEYPPYDQFPETLATTLGYTLPLREEVERIRSFNESLKEKIQHLQAVNTALKTRLDEYDDSVESLDALDPDQFHPKLNSQPLPPLEIRKRFRAREKLLLKKQESILSAVVEKICVVEARSMNIDMNDDIFGVTIEYPSVKRDDGNFITMHGIDIPNPYAWLEEPNIAEISTFLRQQEEFANNFLYNCEQRGSFADKLACVLSCKQVQCPLVFQDSYYHLETDVTAENVPMLFHSTKTNTTPELIFDFAAVLCEYLLLESTTFSNDGTILAYILSDTSHSEKRIHFYDVVKRAHISDVVSATTGNFVFVRNSGIIYEGEVPDVRVYNKKLGTFKNVDRVASNSDSYPKLFYHNIGTLQEVDTMLTCSSQPCIAGNIKTLQTSSDYSKVVVTLAAPDIMFGESVLFMSIPENNLAWSSKSEEIISADLCARFQFICNDGPHWYFITDKYAENGRIVDVDINHPDNSHWKWRTVVGEQASKTILWASCFARGKLMICYLEEGRHTLVMTQLSGGEHIEKIPLEIGSIRGYYGRQDSYEFLFQFTSFLVPSRIYRILISCSGKAELDIFSEAPIPGNDPENQETQQLFYHSKDSTVIPMFVVASTVGEKLSTQPPPIPKPCLLSVFGGFGLCITPAFSSIQYTFLQDFHGIIAIPLVRGGGELGKKWHAEGARENKYKSVEDLVAAAEFLIEMKYTTPSQLFIEGTSHGGFLSAAALNQRPDLFAGAIIQSGILDLIRFPSHVSGKSWKEDFGDPKEDPQDFTTTYKLSPLHNINPRWLLDVTSLKPFPAVFLLLEKFESQILSLHSYKFISELQHQLCLSRMKNPGVILRSYCSIECPTNKVFTNQALLARVDKEVDMLSFIYQVLQDLRRNSASTMITPSQATI